MVIAGKAPRPTARMLTGLPTCEHLLHLALQALEFSENITTWLYTSSNSG
ncbi:MAG: hypothetical protein M3461_11370 [Pseudomonadota bacterium]|nr:hypothetical protein [Pseudomonadota bacterium]